MWFQQPDEEKSQRDTSPHGHSASGHFWSTRAYKIVFVEIEQDAQTSPHSYELACATLMHTDRLITSQLTKCLTAVLLVAV